MGKLYFAEGGTHEVLDGVRTAELVERLLAELGPAERVLLLPPDYTRRHSGAGELTALLYRRLSASAYVEILPALGTHAPMSEAEMGEMFPEVPLDRFRVHRFRSDVGLLGEVPASFVRTVSDDRVAYPIRCELARCLLDGRWDRIVSIGQLVPHEVIGIASHDKNVFVGVGGKDVIDRTHFLGAVCGMESIMGRSRTPVRDVLSYMAREFGAKLPIVHLLTVRSRDAAGVIRTRGLFAGEGSECFDLGSALARACNLELLTEPLKRVVVYLDPLEFKSTWLGNKAIYRTRMALADGAQLIVLAPGVRKFGEDAEIDGLIRRHGYRGTERTLRAVERDPELANALSAAAHLIHGSSEDRFEIVYAPGGLSREEVTAVGYDFLDLGEGLRRYDPDKLTPGMNRVDGEDVFFVKNPALGLWGLASRFG